MSNERDGFIQSASDGGVAAKHPPQQTHPVLVGPSTSGEFNTIKAALLPIACWRVDDIRFEFDSSFVKPDISAEMTLLAKLVREHPGAPASVFGHADPVGNDDYNKKLSGRRAAAIYGMLTRNTEIWEDIYSQSGEFTSPLSSDNWGLKVIQTILQDLGYSPGPMGGVMGSQTREAVKAFQRDNDLSDDGDPGPQTRAVLFLKYMDKHCRDENDQPFKLERTDFLAQGADPAGKGDYQGCSEFNPVLMFSQEENERFRQARDHTERNAANAPNRRVDVFLFRPGSRVSAERWPCPRAKDGVERCIKRFWSDAERRRSFQAERREQERTRDTFACRFYDRIAGGSPCERLAVPVKLLRLRIVDRFRKPVGAVKYTLRVEGQVRTGTTGDDSILTETNLPGSRVTVSGTHYCGRVRGIPRGVTYNGNLCLCEC
ncbi:peptidoglycan-binding protein [Candidatus Poribacteria bacterium]|nr:peptidoglycan-binding protein [Candidatus Poribacteria bacterium]